LSCEMMNGEGTDAAPILSLSEEEPAAAVSGSTPEASKLRLCELALVVGVGFLGSLLGALWAWWTDAPIGTTDFLGGADRILRAILAIAVLAYVLYRQGRSLRTIGLSFRRTDILWALAILFFDQLMTHAIYRDIHGLAAFKPYPIGAAGLLAGLAVIPGAAKEELIVRAYLMTEVAELTGNWGIAVVASVGFQSLYHLYQGTPAALMDAGTFLVSSLFYANTRRITPVILAHALHNFFFYFGSGG
jgi:membrane protease YdiL (CAAX protease family)